MKISILLHKNDPYPKKKYHLLWVIAKFWKQMGIQIEVLKGIPKRITPTDLLIPHIDLTRVPDKYCNFINRFPKVLNRQITDISKRKVSDNLISQTDSYMGPVIVKTDLNYGGIPEQKMSRLYRLNKKWRDKLGFISGRKWNSPDSFQPESYTVFHNPEEVPSKVWSNPDFVVEKFIPEKHEDYYCVRICLFLGDVVLNSRVYSLTPVIKGSTGLSEPVPLPDEIKQYQAEKGFDYGKFDYVIHHGKVHILDMNKTPGILNDPSANSRIGAKLAKGILKYFD